MISPWFQKGISTGVEVRIHNDMSFLMGKDTFSLSRILLINFTLSKLVKSTFSIFIIVLTNLVNYYFYLGSNVSD